MTEIIGKLRWFPLGPTEGPLENIKKDDLDDIAKKHMVDISLEEMRGALQGDTRGKAIEQITQWVVTVSANNEAAFRGVIRALVKKYRAPRTTYATLGSDEKAHNIIVELFNEEDGWF